MWSNRHGLLTEWESRNQTLQIPFTKTDTSTGKKEKDNKQCCSPPPGKAERKATATQLCFRGCCAGIRSNWQTLILWSLRRNQKGRSKQTADRHQRKEDDSDGYHLWRSRGLCSKAGGSARKGGGRYRAEQPGSTTSLVFSDLQPSHFQKFLIYWIKLQLQGTKHYILFILNNSFFLQQVLSQNIHHQLVFLLEFVKVHWGLCGEGNQWQRTDGQVQVLEAWILQSWSQQGLRVPVKHHPSVGDTALAGTPQKHRHAAAGSQQTLQTCHAHGARPTQK